MISFISGGIIFIFGLVIACWILTIVGLTVKAILKLAFHLIGILLGVQIVNGYHVALMPALLLSYRQNPAWLINVAITVCLLLTIYSGITLAKTSGSRSIPYDLQAKRIKKSEGKGSEAYLSVLRQKAKSEARMFWIYTLILFVFSLASQLLVVNKIGPIGHTLLQSQVSIDFFIPIFSIAIGCILWFLIPTISYNYIQNRNSFDLLQSTYGVDLFYSYENQRRSFEDFRFLCRLFIILNTAAVSFISVLLYELYMKYAVLDFASAFPVFKDQPTTVVQSYLVLIFGQIIYLNVINMSSFLLSGYDSFVP